METQKIDPQKQLEAEQKKLKLLEKQNLFNIFIEDMKKDGYQIYAEPVAHVMKMKNGASTIQWTAQIFIAPLPSLPSQSSKEETPKELKEIPSEQSTQSEQKKENV